MLLQPDLLHVALLMITQKNCVPENFHKMQNLGGLKKMHWFQQTDKKYCNLKYYFFTFKIRFLHTVLQTLVKTEQKKNTIHSKEKREPIILTLGYCS